MGNTNSKTPNLVFHIISNKSDAEQHLNEAEKQDFYLEECFDQVSNAKAREKLSYRPNSFAVHDYQGVVLFLERAKDLVPKRLQMDLKTVNIIQLMPSADDGMPHTRPNNIICFPDISQLYSMITLKHELWHVHQRNYQELWLSVFRSIGWKPWKGVLPERLEQNRRLNPDTIDHPNWVFQDTWVPIPIFRNITHPKVSDVDIYFYHVFEKYHTKKIPSELSFYFSGLPMIAFEHPREVTAYMLSEPEKYGHSKGFKDLIEQIGHISLS
jgi:hypothetical protein